MSTSSPEFSGLAARTPRMSSRLLLLLACFALPAFADDADCEALRRTLALAARASVDTGDLRRLEPQVCSRPVERAACQQLSDLWLLAMALAQPAETLSALEAQRSVWCGRESEPTRALQWPDGHLLRSTSGSLNWPNGVMARSTSGSWSSPEGVMVRSSSGSLSYPGGSLARSSSGRWSLPSGEQADEGRIASLACARDLQWCRFFLGEASRSTGLTRDFALLGVGILAGRED